MYRQRYWGGDLELGLTDGHRRLILREEKRFLHVHVLGLSGKGKTSFLSSMIRQDILNKQGVCVLDPHGGLFDDLVAWCAQYRRENRRTIRLFNPSEPRFAFGFNPLAVPDGYQVSGVVDSALRAFSAAWDDEDHAKTPRMQRILRTVCYTLAASGWTLVEAPQLLRTEGSALREYLADSITADLYRMASDDLGSMSPREFREQVESTMNRLFTFLDAPIVQTILGQRGSVFDAYKAMEEGEVMLVNLKPDARHGFSGDDARLIGNLLVNAFFTTALARKPNVSRPFYLYIDEAYDFLSKDIERILDQTRKFGLHLVLSHQRIGQLRAKGEAIESGVMAGAQTKIVFGLGRKDALEIGYDLFGEYFDLEKPKASLIRPVAVGQEIRLLKNHTRSESAISGRTRGIARGTHAAETESEAESDTDSWQAAQGTTESESFGYVKSSGETSAWGSYEGLSGEYLAAIPSGQSWGTSLSGTASTGHAASANSTSAVSASEAYGGAHTSIRGRAKTRGTSDVESTSWTDATQTGITEGESEALATIYKDMPTATYSLDELKHLASVELSRLGQRQAYVKVPDQPPVKILADLLTPGQVRPSRLEEFVLRLHTTCEYTRPARVIEHELAHRPQRLLLEAAMWRRKQEEAARPEEPEPEAMGMRWNAG